MHPSWLKMQSVGNRLPVTNSPTEPEGMGELSPPQVGAKLQPALRDPPGVSADQFSELYSNYFDVAWRTLRRYGVLPNEIEDALQEVFLTIHKRLDSFEGRSSLRTWIFGIARRVARNHRSGRELELCEPGWLDALPADRTNGSPNQEEYEQAKLLYSLMAELTAERREILVLVELEHLTVAEAAEILGENHNTLHSRLRAARSDLAAVWARRKASDEWRRGCAVKNQR